MKRRRKKSINKWKLKRWYEVVAPQVFDEKIVGEIISSDELNLKDRIVDVPLVELIQNKMPETIYSTLKFRVKDVKDNRVITQAIGMELAFSYLRSLAGRRRTVIHEVVEDFTKDGQRVKLKFLIVTKKKVSATVKYNLRKALNEKAREVILKNTYDELIKNIVNSNVNLEITKHLNKINPINVALVKKFELSEQFN